MEEITKMSTEALKKMVKTNLVPAVKENTNWQVIMQQYNYKLDLSLCEKVCVVKEATSVENEYDTVVKCYQDNAAFLEKVAEGDQLCWNYQREKGIKSTPIQYTFQPQLESLPRYPRDSW